MQLTTWPCGLLPGTGFSKVRALLEETVCNTEFPTASQTEAEVKFFPLASLPLASLVVAVP